ncbi:MAG: sulfatase-like hydrolase/transferase [Culturomica sp.]|jgi:phosphoglycerol transferase MdoB-like AlkP superfamily enzyme|nr:sulfatase-like hydrolase/transferase [Culturomica sp.]
MRIKFLFLCKYYLFWMLLSVAAKVLFLIYEPGGSLRFGDYCLIFWKGIRLDLSLGGYILMLASLLMAGSVFLRERILKPLLAVVTCLLLTAFWSIVVVDLELFRNWGYHLDASPLLYLRTPGEALASVSNTLIWSFLLLFLLLLAGSFCLYLRWIARPFRYQTGGWVQIPVFLLLGGSMILPVRGGFNVAPMNASFVWFHKTSLFANQAAVNPVWNFMYEALHYKRLSRTYHYLPAEEAAQRMRELYRPEGNTTLLLKNNRPNIVVLLLESFTADAVEALGGEPGVTPHLSQLAGEGVLFSRVYASGNRSDRGLASVISAYPAHPGFSLLDYPAKMAERPRFSKDLEAAGYHTCFYYAGDINFGGFRPYITLSFQQMVTETDFSGEAKQHTFKWGVHDEYLLEKLYRDIASAPQPFLYMAFTMSSHEPFEVPGEKPDKNAKEPEKFKNAIRYTDRCIGDFVRKCKASGMWENTLLVLIADHGTIKIKQRKPYEPEAFRIPVIFAGGALKQGGITVPAIGSQTDLVATLFGQLQVDHSAYKYSKNLLADGIFPFAFYAYSGMAGLVTEAGITVLNLQNDQIITGDDLPENATSLRAYLQTLDQDLNR